MPFKLGEIANPKGRGVGAKPFQAALSRVLAQDTTKLRKIADQLVNAAMAGEPWAIQMIADRLDGKVIQQIQTSVDELNLVPPALLESATKLLYVVSDANQDQLRCLTLVPTITEEQ